MQPAFFGIAIVLGLVAICSYVLAGYMFLQDQGEGAMPLIVTATTTLGMIVVLGAVMRKKKE
ncbi:MAG: hypothetical protein ACK46Q_16135 [Hyphomonas sp.]